MRAGKDAASVVWFGAERKSRGEKERHPGAAIEGFDLEQLD